MLYFVLCQRYICQPKLRNHFLQLSDLAPPHHHMQPWKKFSGGAPPVGRGLPCTSAGGGGGSSPLPSNAGFTPFLSTHTSPSFTLTRPSPLPSVPHPSSDPLYSSLPSSFLPRALCLSECLLASPLSAKPLRPSAVPHLSLDVARQDDGVRSLGIV
jgi:hypothetical protein